MNTQVPEPTARPTTQDARLPKPSALPALEEPAGESVASFRLKRRALAQELFARQASIHDCITPRSWQACVSELNLAVCPCAASAGISHVAGKGVASFRLKRRALPQELFAM